MDAPVSENKPSGFDRPAPRDVVRFLNAIFDPRDYVLVRPVESWIEGSRKRSQVIYRWQRWPRACILSKEAPWQSLLRILENHRANAFFGVCPRFGPKGLFDLSWQIRTVRVLWADLDHCTVEEALKRCPSAGLPPPSIVVGSGNGAHLYWILDEPYLIDDVDRPPAVWTEWIDQGPDKKKLVRKYVKGEDGQPIYLYLRDQKTSGDTKVRNPDCPWGKLSAKARHVQDVLTGLAVKIGGDHTNDLVRCLRLPGTMNRKDERNGKQPVPCELVECDPARRYPFADFETLAVVSPERQRREKVAAIQLPTPRTLKATFKSKKREDQFRALVNACAAAEPGQRSERDWNLVCWAVENGIDREELWQTVAGIGKFAERGRDYFDRTLAKAEEHTREKIYERACAKSNGKASRNGTASTQPSGPEANGPDEPEGEDEANGDGGRPLPESDTDPHRLSREWLTRCAQYERPGDCAAYYRQEILRWSNNRWRSIPD